jgi:RHS repeat-associated protein
MHGDEAIAHAATTTLYHGNQQYSVTAISDSSGNVSERYAYTAYGQPTFLNASGAVQTSSAANNRYTYTGREWDATLGLYHFRARWISGMSGRFLTRDPTGYWGSEWDLYEYVKAKPLDHTDFSGTHDFPPGVNPESIDDLINYIKKLQRELTPEQFRKKLEEIRNSLRDNKEVWRKWIGAEKRAGPRNPNKPGRGGKGQTGGRKGICKVPIIKYLFLLECEGACAYYYNFCLDSAQADMEENMQRCNGLPFADRQACFDNEFYIWQLNATECGVLYSACGLACLLPVDVGIE